MGTLHRKAGTHDRHENIRSLSTIEGTPEKIRLRACNHRYGGQRANRQTRMSGNKMVRLPIAATSGCRGTVRMKQRLRIGIVIGLALAYPWLTVPIFAACCGD